MRARITQTYRVQHVLWDILTIRYTQCEECTSWVAMSINFFCVHYEVMLCL